jgi:glycosyltransferase involved in cell wall biosynthesis
MRIIALPGDVSGCGYYRVYAPLRAMQRQGLAKVFEPPVTEPKNGGKPQIYIKPSDIKGFDVALFQRQPEQRITELFEIAKSFGTHVVFDLDDDLYTVPPSSPAYIFFGRDWRKIGAMAQANGHITRAVGEGKRPRYPGNGSCEEREHAAKEWAAQSADNFKGVIRNLRAADMVTVSTEVLRGVYSKHRDDIVVLRNQIEPRDWEDAIANPHERDDGEVWIGWAGSSTHWADLKEVAGAVKQVLRRNDLARLVLVGFPKAAELFEGSDDQVITFDWMSLTEYRRVVAAFDVALAPSAAIQFNAGKSDIRVLEAALCGVPVVGSETTYGDTVREAGCGFVAKSTQKWARYLNRLVCDAELRKEMGSKGREYVLDSRTYDANAWRWAEAYGRLVA